MVVMVVMLMMMMYIINNSMYVCVLRMVQRICSSFNNEFAVDDLDEPH